MSEGDGAMDEVRVVPEVGECTICGGLYRGKIGLGLHMRRAHPADYFRGLQVRGGNRVWAEDERIMLAEIEVEIVANGYEGQLVDRLAERMAGRTRDAIKGIRRLAEYRRLVQEIRERGVAEDVRHQVEVADEGVGARDVPEEAIMREGWLDEAEEWRTCVSSPGWMLFKAVEAWRMGMCPWDWIEGWLMVRFPGTPLLVESGEERIRHRPGSDDTGNRPGWLYGLWKRDRRAAMSEIMNSQETRERLTVDELEGVWRPLMEEPSAVWVGVPKACGIGGRIWDRIDLEEIVRYWPGAKAAAGPDRISPKAWKRVPVNEVRTLFNLVLVVGGWPKWLLRARTTFIPKTGGGTNPLNQRPITVGSVAVRHLHKILAGRTIRMWQMNSGQMGFRAGVDGVGVNIGRLRAALRKGIAGKSGIHLAVMDLKKAFDSVSHNALWAVLEAKGVERSFIDYLKGVYQDGRTVIGGRDGWSREVRVGRGVRQGDPLSGPLFNVIVDHILLSLDSNFGFDLNGTSRQAIAYADDVVLMAKSKKGLERQLDFFVRACASVGLEVNQAKSVYVGWQWKGKSKKVVPVASDLTGGGMIIKPLGWGTKLRYLGIYFERDGTLSRKIDLQMLEKVRDTALPAHALVETLAEMVIPGWLQQVVLGGASCAEAKKIDAKVRTVLKTICGLPKDVPNSFFHAGVKWGGLGVISLEAGITEWRRKRWKKILEWEQSQEGWGMEDRSGFWEANYGWTRGNRFADIGQEERRGEGRMLDGEGGYRRALANQWWSSVDGADLKEASRVKASTRWVRERAEEIPDRDWKGFVRIRAGALPSLMRLSRGRPRIGPAVRCRGGCMLKETTAHIVQGCSITRGGVRFRHHAVVKLLAKAAEIRGVQVWHETAVREGVEVWRPDMVWRRGQQVAVVDVQIVTGTQSMSELNKVKEDKYNTEGIKTAVKELVGVDAAVEVQMLGVTLSWKGVWCAKSVEKLSGWGISGKVLEYAVERVLRGTAMNFNSFRKRCCT